MLNQKLTGQQAAEKTYIEDVFSTYLYTGNGSTQTINNGIDLAGKGGMVWVKSRSNAYGNRLVDTNRGESYSLSSDSTNAQAQTGLLSSFNSNGFSLNSPSTVNASASTYASWTFRKAPKFFDVVTYTGNGGNRYINHSLGQAPGMVIIKRTDNTSQWVTWHTSLSPQNNTYRMLLNLTYAYSDGGADYWGASGGTPDMNASSFSIGDANNVSGGTYVAYLFAHDTTTDGLIQCGSFTTNGSGAVSNVELGWEPQYILIKSTNGANDWFIIDNMRGMSVSSNDTYLRSNSAGAESAGDIIQITSTGFSVLNLAYNKDHIYMAIRRAPMRTPTDGTKVFYPLTISQSDTPDSSGVPFPPDLVNTFSRNGSNRTLTESIFLFSDRLRGLGVPNNTWSSATGGIGLSSSNTSGDYSSAITYIQLKADGRNITRGPGWGSVDYGNWINYFFKRAPGFFDIVCYTGTGVARTVNHNLGVAPELMIVKSRSSAIGWQVYANPLGNTDGMYLNTTAATQTVSWWNNTTPTNSVFSLGSSTGNNSGVNFVAYLFASCPGVSKVGGYTGNGSSQTINCGFTNGARFVLIKRTDSTGDWYVWDTARGIVAGNDPRISLNTTALEVTTDDTIDPDSTGFIVNQVTATNVNVSGGSYIYLAIA